MSEHVYTFNLSIGFPSAEHQETFDLVEDLGYDAEDLGGEADLAAVLDRELEEWQWQHIEAWAEKQ